MVFSLISAEEDDTICQEYSRLLPGARNVLLASLIDMEENDKLVGWFPVYSLISVVEDIWM